MFPIGIEIELSAESIDSYIGNQLGTSDLVFERDLKPRKSRKKPPPTVQEYLDQKVPGRHKETAEIAKYIRALEKGDKSSLCLHGSTGCGKTSLVTQLMCYLRLHNEDTQVIYINCLTYTSIRGIYSTILNSLFDKKDKKPQQALSNLFSDPQSTTEALKLIIFDEIDQCFSNKSFIYNILEWIQISTFPLGVILISNMVDFASNLENKSKSRLKFNSIIFAPYHYEELIEIVRYKYPESRFRFDDDAIIFLCKKIAGINSDVRLIQKYYADAIRSFGNSRMKICLASVQSLFGTSSKGNEEILKPYMFILEILWRSPKRKNICQDIEHFCLGNAIPKYKQPQIMSMLYDLQSMGIVKITNVNKNSDFYYNYWGINLQEYAYTLQATRNKI